MNLTLFPRLLCATAITSSCMGTEGNNHCMFFEHIIIIIIMKRTWWWWWCSLIRRLSWAVGCCVAFCIGPCVPVYQERTQVCYSPAFSFQKSLGENGCLLSLWGVEFKLDDSDKLLRSSSESGVKWKSDQHLISSYSIHTILNRQAMRVEKIII